MSRNPFAPPSDDQKNPKSITPPGSSGTPWESETPERSSQAASPTSPRSHINGIPTADWQPRQHKKDTRKRGKSRKLPLIQKNWDGIKKYTSHLDVPEYELVRYLLEYGLDQADKGSLVFEPQLSQEGLTLYPKEKRSTRKSRKGRADLVSATYRGIPDETWETLKTLASDYPIWQVANKLIEGGIDGLESGELNPNPQSSGTKTLY